MDTPSLKLEPRSVTGKKVKNLRKQGLVPASICGKGIQTETLQLDAKEFDQVYRHVGRNGLIELQLPGGTQSGFVRQVQRHPVTQQYYHVDFRIVDLNTEMVAEIPIVAVGENTLVEKGQGVLSMPLPTLHVRGLPGDLPQAIEVDIGQITDFTTTLHVRDLKVSDRITVLTPEDEAVATITESRMEAESEELIEEAQSGDMAIADQHADDNRPTEAETSEDNA